MPVRLRAGCLTAQYLNLLRSQLRRQMGHKCVESRLEFFIRRALRHFIFVINAIDILSIHIAL